MKYFGSGQSLLGKLTRACRAPGLGLAIAAASSLVPAQTVTFGPATFSKSVDVADTTLYLNGAGIRYRFGFKVYAAVLYLQNKATSPEAALSASGPKRVQLVMLREVDGNELGKLFIRGIESNTPKSDDLSEIVPGTGILGDAFAVVFAGGKKLGVGESLGLDFVPGIGTVLSHNGKRVGELIKEPQFFVALMRIWLGQNPADRQLKDAMLGQAAFVPAKSSM